MRGPIREQQAGKASPAHSVPSRNTPVPIVAIGASAGGLDGLFALLGGMPKDCGVAFVVLMHMGRESKSALPELLTRHTQLTVQAARNGASFAAAQVFVARPGTEITVSGGKLSVARLKPGDSDSHTPIDRLMKSLAADQGRHAIGIVLSGMGSDGTQGLKAVKEAGGLTLVQDPAEAEYGSMPRHAIASAQPDHVLPAADMPGALMQYIAHGYVNGTAEPKAGESAAEPEWLGALLTRIQQQTGKDFSLYKAAMVQRRVERRMAFRGIEDHAAYCSMLLDSPEETEALSRDLTINVTAFFRDPEVFDALAPHLRKLIESHTADQAFRAWIVGCSTGEEAYSIAIMLFEQMAAAGRPPNLKVFATDIDEDAISAARTGLYPATIADTLSPDRLRRFFVGENGGFRVVPMLREAVVFSQQDALRDPPISNLDLVACRNLLIYLTPKAQERILQKLLFALRENGILLLGASEEAAPSPHLAEAVDKRRRIYRRSQLSQNGRARFSLIAHHPLPGPSRREEGFATVDSRWFFDQAEAVIRENGAAAATVATRELLPVYFFGEIERYLYVPSGAPTAALPARIHTASRRKLRDALTRTIDGEQPVTLEIDIVSPRDETLHVRVESRRLSQNDQELVLVSFIEAAGAAGPRGNDVAGTLKAELADTRHQLDRTILQLREINEEIRRKNEELMSLNEEFLSTNEELQASKDELNGLNRELLGANRQLHDAVSRQTQAATDLSNLLDSSPVGTILLDDMLRIKLFNPRMKDLFALIDTDIGRPLADLLPKFADPTLIEDANRARSTGQPSVREIQGVSGAWYVRSVQPYRTKTAEIRGAVVTFADVSALKEAELASASARHYAETIVDTAREPLLVVDGELRVEAANPAFCTALNIPAEEVLGRNLRYFKQPLLADPTMVGLMQRVLDGRDAAGSLEIETSGDVGEQRIWKVHVRSFGKKLPEKPRILVALEDITEQRHIVRHQLQLLIDALPQPIIAVDRHRKLRFVSNHVEAMFGYKPAELVGREIDILLPPGLREKHAALFETFTDKPSVRGMGTGLDVHGLTKDGIAIPLDIGLSPIATADGPLIVAALHDLRGLRAGEHSLRAAKAEADRANQAKTRFLAAASHDLRQPLQTLGLLIGVLEKRTAGAEVRATIARLDDTVAHMTDLVDTLLDVNQIESGAINVDIGEFQLGSLLSRVSDDFGPLAAAKGLDLRLVETSALIRSDRRLLSRAIGNLVSNAIKYTETGKVLIGCRRHAGMLYIEVWDSGIGIPPHSIDAVFDEFYRVDRANSSEFGLGLGLYIVKRFVQLLGHQIEVRSAPGRGTVFRIIVADPAFTTGVGDIDHKFSWHPTLLLVEDDLAQLDALQALLTLEGYHVIAARDGSEALARIHDGSAHPSVIVADYNLPGKLNGLDVIRRVRHEVGSGIPALLVSGSRPAATLDAAEFADFLFVAKPVKAASLVTTVNTLIKRALPDWRPTRQSAGTTILEAALGDRPQIAIIDDDPGVREAAAAILIEDGYGVRPFASSEAFLADPDHGQFGCVVADIGMPGIDGLELQRRLKAEGESGLPLIFITGNSDLPPAVEAMRQGALDFLQKPVDRATLRESVARALKASAGIETPSASERADVAARLATLTERERQVLEQIVGGALNKNIAIALGISQRTTEHHRQNVMRKMGVKSLAMLVRMVGVLPAANGASPGAEEPGPDPAGSGSGIG